METTKYAFKTKVNFSYEEAIQKVTEELKIEGFGVLTEIDVKETLKKKLTLISKNTKYLGHAIHRMLTKHWRWRPILD